MREQSTITRWFVIAPLTFVQGPSFTETAETGARPLSILIHAFVNIAVRVHDLPLAISETFKNLTLVNDIFYLSKFVLNFIKEVLPVARHLRYYRIRNFEHFEGDRFRWLNFNVLLRICFIKHFGEAHFVR
jgi:hypothetical protein